MKHYKYLLQGLLLLCLLGCKEDTRSAMPKQLMFSSDAVASSHGTANPEAVRPKSAFVCKSAGAKRYHYNENCQGLKRCKHVIEKTTIKKADAVGLTLCKFED